MTKFFMLYREGGRSPTVKHSAEGDAKREAERIAREHGGSVYLLEAVAKVEVKWESIVVTRQAQATKFPGEWVDFDIAWCDMRAEIERHPTLRLAGTNSDPDVEVGYAGSGCIVRALTEFGADWLMQRKERAQPNGPPTPEQAKAHIDAHDVGCGWGRWLHPVERGAPIACCLNRLAVVESSTGEGLCGKNAVEIGGKWFPLAADGSPLPAKDPDDGEIPF